MEMPWYKQLKFVDWGFLQRETQQIQKTDKIRLNPTKSPESIDW